MKQLQEIHLQCLLPDSKLKFLNKEDLKTDSPGTQLAFSNHFYIKINNNLKFTSKYLNGRRPWKSFEKFTWLHL
jgi:DNA polymerase III sliding clamp (beta) subunit (PCNA family)